MESEKDAREFLLIARVLTNHAAPHMAQWGGLEWSAEELAKASA